MRRTLTPSQKDALISFAEEHGDFLDSLLSLDRDEFERIADDQIIIGLIDDDYYGNDARLTRALYSEEIRQQDACQRLRRELKQTVEA